MATKKKRREPKKLPQYEWDFSSCPSELIWDCWLFEYSREHVKLGGTLHYLMGDFFTKNMQFPKTPFLQLHKIGRTPLPSSSNLETNKGNSKTLDKELALLAKYLSAWGSHNGIHATKKRANWDDIWKIKIDWTYSDTKLIEEFSRLIREIRPGKYLVGEKRGTDFCSAKSAELKKLGAFRLLAAGYTAKRAIEYTEKISGHPLISHAPDWSGAKKEAKRILSAWPPDPLCQTL